jgi:predicted ATPase
LGNINSQLLTLTGAGGSAKTWLALHVGGSVIFVDSSPLTNTALVIPAIANAAGRSRLCHLHRQDRIYAFSLVMS